MAKIIENPTLITSLHHSLTFVTDADVNSYLLTKFRNYEWLYLYDEDNAALLNSIINEWSPYVEQLYATTRYEYDPIENYNRVEEYTGDDKTTYGRKDSRNTDLKESVNTDFKTEHNVDATQGINAGMKTSHNQNVITTPNTTDTSIHKDAGYDNNVSTESSRDELTRTGTETVTASDEHNYDETVGLEENNFTHNTADAEDNYEHSTGDAEDNYRQTVGTAANNYSQLSGQDKLDKHYKLTARGNIGTMSTQQMIQMERDIIVNVMEFYAEKFSRCFNIKADGLYNEMYSAW